MTDFFSEIATLSPKRLALLALELKERLDATDERAREPIAVVGLGCRFPGAESPDAFARLLDDGGDAIREIPRDRWDIDAYFDSDPDVPGKMNTRYGGFIDGIDRFDPAHFGIAPREAAGMDPQQRLVLEVAWEALEHAGLAPDRLAGSQTGVFLGIATLDYASLVMQGGERSLDLYSSSGGSHAVAAGRLSYVLGLHGPALSVDTACSSSLVAAHLACQSLRSRECDTALVGGVNVICAPETTLMLSRARMMAPDGRCKTFDERADGFVRGEGCGVLVLRRLSDAQAAGDRVLAVIRGSAVNQDGRSSGLTAPNGPSQEAVIRAALANAGLSAADVGYVEAHGTGTALGDPIELRALGATYGAGRSAHNALIASSVKTNFGHLEAAAGVAGMAKAILALQRGRIPAHLHLQTPTSHVDWSTLGVRLPSPGGEDWPRGTAPRRAAVSSFGFSGTNAHVILEEAPTAAPVSTPTGHATRPQYLLPISGRTTAAVRELAGRYAAFLGDVPPDRWPDVCDEAAAGRSQMTGSRAAVLAPSAADAVPALERMARAEGVAQSEQVDAATVIAAEDVVGAGAELAFVFTGQGGAHVGMGRALYEEAPVFRDAMARLDAAFTRHTGVSLIDVLYGESGAAFTRPDVSAAALVAFQIALAELWRSWGVEPVAVAGHSLGEYAAAVTAGALGADDALRLVAARGRAVGALPATEGAMAIVDASAATIEETLGESIGAPAALEIAAVNAPEQVVLTGPVAQIDHAERLLLARDIRVRRLGGLSHAYHSAQLEPMLSAFEALCQTATYHSPTIEWVSCLTGETHPAGSPVGARYWIDQMRHPVQWRRVVEALAERGARVLIEIGPTAVLSGLSRASLEAIAVSNAVSLPSMRAGVDNWHTLLDTIGRGWVRGMPVDWTRLEQGTGARLRLPTYPFQRQRYWLSASPASANDRRRSSAAVSSTGGLLGLRLDGPVPTFPVRIDATAPAVLRDHVVQGRPLFAGSAFIDIALSAAATSLGGHDVMLRDIRFLAPLEVGADDREALVTVAERDEGESTITLASRSMDSGGDDRWIRHARTVVTVAPPPATDARHTEPTVLMATLPEVVDHDAVYAAFRDRGIALGASVRVMHKVWRRDGEALARLELPASLAPADRRAALLDGALQTFGVAAPAFHRQADATGDGELRVLARIGTARVHADLERAAWCHATLVAGAASAPWTGQLTLLDVDGTVIARFEDLSLVMSTRPVVGTPDSLTYALAWEPRALPVESAPLPCDALARAAFEQLAALGETHGFAEYDALIPVLESTAATYARDAMVSLGLAGLRGPLTDAALAGVAPPHHRLVRRLWALLAAGAIETPDAQRRADARLLGSGEIELLDRCGPALADVLRGHVDPIALLFPNGSFDVLDRLYRDSPFARTYNGALRETLRAEVNARGGVPLRILEIGAGTGGTTGYVLDVLPPGSRYVFTDLSPLFLERARQRFGSHPELECRLLNVEMDPSSQGFSTGTFDVVIASNVLHATADVRASLEHVRQLAAPGALLLMLEGTAPLHWVDVTFGLTDGWWRFTDHDLRPEHPLIDASRWVSLLHEVGFADAASACVEARSPSVATTQSLLVARTPVSTVGRQLPLPPPLLVLADDGGAGDALCALARNSGSAVEVMRRGDGDIDEVERRIAAFRSQHAEEAGIVYLWGLDVASGVAPDTVAVTTAATLTETVPLAVMRAVAGPNGGPARLWVVTRGAQPVSGSSDVRAPEQAPLWGWWRGFALEHPAACGACVDVDPDGDVSDAARLIFSEIRSDTLEDQVAIRGGERRVARLVRRAAPPAASVSLRRDGAYLVTGGTGGLGLRVAQWLAQHGAGELVLASRAGLPEDPADARHATFESLRQGGCLVHVVRADVADQESLSSVLARFGTEWRPLRGIVHTAVQMSSGPIAELPHDKLESMRRSKVDSTRLLDRLTREAPLDFFVLYSSTTALLGVQGLAHYAAANQYLEALAHHRRARGQAALSIAWGTWDVMRIATAAEQASIARGGLHQLSSDVALDLQGRLMAAGETSAVVADVDWSTLVPLYEARRARPLIHALAATVRVARDASPRDASPRDASLRPREADSPMASIRLASPTDRTLLVQRLVRREVAAVLGYGSDDGIPIDRGFFELGLDSLMSVELKRRLEAAVERALPSTLTFNYPNVAALTAFLMDELFALAAPTPAASSPAISTPSTPASSGARDSDDMSIDELEAELLARLDRLQ